MDPTSSNTGGNQTSGQKPDGDLPNNTHGEDSEEFVERFEDLKFPELAFQDNWTLWEQYETKHSSDYKNTMQKIACFNDPVSFWKVWNVVPHSNPLNFIHYFDEEKGDTVCRQWKVRGEDTKISALSLFKTGIKPAWEDPVNAMGGDFSVKTKCSKEDIIPLWEGIILEAISGNFPHSDQI